MVGFIQRSSDPSQPHRAFLCLYYLVRTFLSKQYFFGWIFDPGWPQPASLDGLIQPFFLYFFWNLPLATNTSFNCEDMTLSLLFSEVFLSRSSRLSLFDALPHWCLIPRPNWPWHNEHTCTGADTDSPVSLGLPGGSLTFTLWWLYCPPWNLPTEQTEHPHWTEVSFSEDLVSMLCLGLGGMREK